MSTPVTTYDKRPVIVSSTAPTSLEQLRYLWLDISETTPVLRYYNNGIWEAINNVDTSSFLTTNGVQTITGAKTFNTGTITVADITVDDVTIEGIDTIKLTDDDTHVPTSKLVEDTLVSAISGLETSIDGELATKANDNEVVKLTGDQIVQGVKEFGNDIYFNGSILFGTSSGTMSSFNNVDQYLDSPSTTAVPSTQAVAEALSEKQNTLKYYSEGTNTVTIETVGQPNNNISVKAGDVGIDVGWDAVGAPYGKFGNFSGSEITTGISVESNGGLDIAAPAGFHINNSTPKVTTIVDSINLQSGGENALPTASAVRVVVNQIKSDLGSALTYKGSVDTYDQLPDEAAVGDTWNVAQAYQTYPAGTNYAWTGTAWDALGGSVDLSGYQTKSDDTLATSAKTVVGAINEVNTALSNKQDKLLYYSETSEDTSSATISASKIKLAGSVAEGNYTVASGSNSHAEGSSTVASGSNSHAEGSSTVASGSNSHTEGSGTIASGIFSHAEGRGTTASGDYQHVQGKYNIEDANDKYADIIGNGSSPSEKSNAATVSWEGISWSQTDVRAGGTDQDSAAHSLSAKQNATDNSLTTTNKTIVGAINELSADKQDTLQFYTESITDAPGYPSGSGIYKEQISLGKNNYSQTINIGGSNNLQNINLGGSVGTYGIITIGTTGSNNQIQIGRDNTNTTLEINAVEVNGTVIDKTALTESSNKLPTSQAVLNGLSAKQNATDNNLTTTDKTIVGAINELDSEVATNTTNIGTLQSALAGTLYFNNAKLFGSNFAIPNFPFSICATVRVDSWEGSTDGMQTIFQFGNNGTGALWGSICFNNVVNNPGIILRISKNTDGALSYSEVSYTLNTDTFLGKEHTIVVNFDIYVDGAKVATTPFKGLTLDSLSGSVNYAVNTVNGNLTSSAASANPMRLRNLCIFNFDVSAEDAPYSIADYVAGRLIPPSLIGNQFTGMYGSGWSVTGDTATDSKWI